MGPLYEDHHQQAPGKKDPARSSVSNPSLHSKPKADIYIPSAPSTGMTKGEIKKKN